MKNSIFIKFLVMFLTALSLVSAIGGAAGIIAMESAGLYVNGVDMLQGEEFDSIANDIATEYADYYAAKHLSNLSYGMRNNDYPNPKDYRGDAKHWEIRIQQADQILLAPKSTEGYTLIKSYTRAPIYPIVSSLGPKETPTQNDTDLNNAAYEAITPPEGYLYYDTKTLRSGVDFDTYYYYYYEAPEYTVTVYMRPEVLESSAVHILTAMYPYRNLFIAIFGAGLLAFAAGLVFLIWSAGKTPTGEIRPGGLNRTPLDVYFLGTGGCIFGVSLLLMRLADWVRYEGPHIGNLSIVAAALLAAILPVIGFIFALGAQVKLPGFLWNNCLLCRIGKVLCRWFARLWRIVRTLYHMLPALWQWLLIRCIVFGFTFVFVMLAVSDNYNHSFVWTGLIICLFAVAIMLLYNLYTYSILLSGAEEMAAGNLKKKIPTRYLLGIYRHFAESLNTLAETAMTAAENEMRSERMKAELITNVSHDIKTPLTSIINYVDLLKQSPDENARAQYLEILSRQSQRMKKLIQDLVEMSKVSSGNIHVECTTLDAAEAATQALGEFSDKLAGAGLTPVLQHPKAPVMMRADGRLTWRVLSNLLSNTVKYALPDTRIFIDVTDTDTGVHISLKNISKDPICVDVQELTERFVRGDTSRNTEGSGLGLHIAKNLMELQGGALHLQCDGDLFKALLTFPKADCS